MPASCAANTIVNSEQPPFTDIHAIQQFEKVCDLTLHTRTYAIEVRVIGTQSKATAFGPLFAD